MQRRTFLKGVAGFAAMLPMDKLVPWTETQPNIVLIVLDTVRAANMNCYGYGRRTAPWTSALARQGVFFTHARSTAPWTLPAHASMFTGRHPFEHGSHRERPDKFWDIRRTFGVPLDDKYLTLAEAFKAEGYATGAFSANTVYLTHRYQLVQGFDELNVSRVSGLAKATDGLNWVKSQRDRPFFAFFNLMDAHAPYNTRPVEGVLQGDVPQDPELERELYGYFKRNKAAEAPRELVRQVTAQYDMGIANADLGVGRIVEHLKKNGQYGNTVIMVTSDHGEYLGEHGLVGHSKDVYEEAIRVPLLVRYPGMRKGEVVDDLVSGVHVPYLLLAGCPKSMRERYRSLCPHQPGTHPVVAENHYARGREFSNGHWGRHFHRVRTATYDGTHKFIRSTDGNDELYDLGTDPAESRNLIENHPETAERLAKQLDNFRPWPEPASKTELAEDMAPLSEQEIEEMKALGYLE